MYVITGNWKCGLRICYLDSCNVVLINTNLFQWKYIGLFYTKVLMSDMYVVIFVVEVGGASITNTE